ncbi:MAG: putative adhesin, partial [Bacteroidota bacterium]
MKNFVRILGGFVVLLCSLSVGAKNWYLNDASTAGDVYCTAIGTVGGTGLTPGSPKLFNSSNANTLKNIVAAASAGDVIFLDVMDVNMTTGGSDILLNKAITIVGAGPTKTILRGPGGTSTAKFAIISASNVVFKNFYCTGWQSTGSGNASCLEVVAGASNLTGIVFDSYWMDNNVGSGGDGSCRISSTGVGTVTATIKNMLTTCNNTGGYAGGFTIYGNGHNITFTSCYFNNNQRITNGGAINIYGTNSSDGVTSQVFIDKCSFISNGNSGGSAVYGGAVCVAGAKLIVTNSCFSNNIVGNTSQYGTAICGLKNSRISISNSTFSNNTGARGQVSTYNSSDAAITAGSYELIIDKCSFDNSATAHAQCIYYRPSSGTFSVNNCTFTSSSGTTQIYSGVAWTLTNSAITSGTNPVSGGTSPSSNTIVPSSTPTPTCNGSVTGSCPTVSLSCSSDNLPPVIKAHDSTYVTNSTCIFT